MALTLNSPGVQITETDYSNNLNVTNGTTVFIAGYASQGPTDEVLQITSVSDLDTIYGTPVTPAERYFYYSAKQILNTPGNLLTTRLPYGSGSGYGFTTTEYSALLFPATSGTNTFSLSAPTHITINESDYTALKQGDVSWTSISGTAGTPTFSSKTLTNVGLVILNSSQTTVNEYFEGYYASVTDNSEFGPDSDFKAVTSLQTLTAADAFYSVPTTRLGFSLSADKGAPGSQSVSQQIERAFSYDFSKAEYNDCLTINLFKVRNSIYDPSLLTISSVETYVGSLNSQRKIADANGGTLKSFYLADAINNGSSNLIALVNPTIANSSIWTTNTTVGGVSARTTTKGLFAPGTFKPTYNSSTGKTVGNIITKLNRALTLIDTPEDVTVDIIADAGLSTIFANTTAAGGTPSTGYDAAASFDDLVFRDVASLSANDDSTNQRWLAVFNTFDKFVSETRKDCVFIADPLRQIFVNGKDGKALSVKTNTFTGSIYNPLKAAVSQINSNYSVIYGNWVKVYDSFSDSFTWLPASSFVSAIYAKSDAATHPWIAPAGLNRGTISGIVDIAVNPNQKQRDYLYLISVNPIAFFNRDGYVVYGQKTLQSKPSAFDRVNVRRLFLSLERAVQNTVKYFVFEPNTDFTRTRLKNTITPIFDLAKNTQGLYDYLIVCDTRNNTPDVIDANELVVDIYIKPVKAAEFILVNFIATRTGQNFQELI
jgi:phage tail sheath protein FI